MRAGGNSNSECREAAADFEVPDSAVTARLNLRDVAWLIEPMADCSVTLRRPQLASAYVSRPRPMYSTQEMLQLAPGLLD